MILGLGYKARSGKDTAGEFLASHYGFMHMAWAHSLKAAAREIFHLTERQLYGDEKEVMDPFWEDTPRNILQKLGTECLRQGYRDDTWVKSLEKKIRNRQHTHPDQDFVVTDVRFVNEAKAIKQWGGYLVKIERPDRTEIATGKHLSEIEMDGFKGWEYTIHNEGTLTQFYLEVERMLSHFRKLTGYYKELP